jgi:hypothetical protein
MKLGLAIAAMGLLAVTAFAAEKPAVKVESGLKVGESPSAFDVVDVSGPNKGAQLCYV